MSSDKAELLSEYSDNYNLARLAAVSLPHSRDWLHGVPIISACDMHLSNATVRVAVGLRLGVNIYIPHYCVFHSCVGYLTLVYLILARAEL